MPPAHTARTTESSGDEYRVRSGDSLSKIAGKTQRSGVRSTRCWSRCSVRILRPSQQQHEPAEGRRRAVRAVGRRRSGHQSGPKRARRSRRRAPTSARTASASPRRRCRPRRAPRRAAARPAARSRLRSRTRSRLPNESRHAEAEQGRRDGALRSRQLGGSSVDRARAPGLGRARRRAEQERQRPEEDAGRRVAARDARWPPRRPRRRAPDDARGRWCPRRP